MSNEELVELIQRGVDVSDNMLKLWMNLRKLISKIAIKYSAFEEKEDLEQEGYFAICSAVKHFDTTAGYKFTTYLYLTIVGHFERYIGDLGSCLRIPLHLGARMRQYHRLCKQFELEYGRKPSEEEIGENLGLDEEQVNRLFQAIHKFWNIGSIDVPVRGGEEEDIISNFISDPKCMEDDLIEQLENEEMQMVLWKCVDGLPGDLPDVIRKRYLDKMKYKDIGNIYRVTGMTIINREKKAMKLLRDPSNSMLLSQYLPETEEIYNSALKGNGVRSFNTTRTSSTERTALQLYGGDDTIK